VNASRARVAVLVSGEGTNLQALIDAARAGHLHADICGVISDRAGARGLERARAAGISAHSVEVARTSQPNYDAALRDALQGLAPDMVVLAGYMRILSRACVADFADRTVNLHPSLLPRHKGTDTHARVLAAGDAEHGATVHFVTADLDAGPRVLQYRLRVSSSDTAETLSARVHRGEHIILPTAVEWFCSGRLRLIDGAVMLDDTLLRQPVIIEERT
jgi:phosphoribosylglycinamide formyltransferase-1